MKIGAMIAFCFLAACGGSKIAIDHDAGFDAGKDASACTGKVGTVQIGVDDAGATDCMQACIDEMPAAYAGSTVLSCQVLEATGGDAGDGDVGFGCNYAQTCAL
jgi:hypothetical protein